MPNFVLRDDFKQGTPGNVCYLCRSCQRVDRTGRREPIVDPNVHIDWEGPVQICETCVVEMGRLVGMVTQAQIVDAENIAADATAALDQALAEVADLRTAVESLTRAGWVAPHSTVTLPLMDAPTLTDAEVSAAVAGIEADEDRPTFVCDLEACDRTFDSEHGLSVHQGKAHREQTTH